MNSSDTCRCCGSKNLQCVVSLGSSPLANNLLDSKESVDDLYPLEVLFCKDCSYCQLSVVVPPSLLFDNYLYVSSTAKSFRDHFKLAADKYISEFNLTSESLVVDIGSNDGVGLRPFKEAGIRIVGVDPAVNVAKLANDNGIETINSYFNSETVGQIITKYGKADLVTASNVFAHSAEIDDITKNVFKLLKNDGCFVIEVQYVADTINDMTFDNIYHEHVSYWSVTSINNFFTNRGYSVVDVEHVNTHGGSIRVYVKRAGSNIKPTVDEFLRFEQEFGLSNIETYHAFFEKIQEVKSNVNSNLKQLKAAGKTIVGYGSPAKATTSLNYYGVGQNYIDYIVEDNKLKHNKWLPGVKIPIYSKEKIKEQKPDVVVIMAWNFANEIKKNNQELMDDGILFVSIKELEQPTFNYENLYSNTNI
jgi:SAM-dependent methyltransferase